MYQTLGDLNLVMGHGSNVENYTRKLDLENAIARFSYSANGVNYTREYFLSAPDQALMVKISCDKPGALNLSAKLARPKDATIRAQGDEIKMFGQVTAGGVDVIGVNPGVHYFSVLTAVPTNGNVVSKGDSLIVLDANSVVFHLTAATNYWGDDPILKLHSG